MDNNTGALLLVDRVMQAIRGRIAARSLAPGAKLPSIRGLAEAMQVSKSTVVEGYDRLAAEGVIQARRGAGFFVVGHAAPLALTKLSPAFDRAIDPLWVSRQSLEGDETVLKPGCGWLPSAWLPQASTRRVLRALARGTDTAIADYATPLGHAPLRQVIARRLGERGVEAPPDQILITESGTHTIDLLCRFFLEPGDTVLVDDPCYFNFRARLQAHRATVVGVPYTPAGPDIALFEQALQTHRPRLYITNSAIHNPTGATLSPVVAHRLLRLAEQHDLLIIEDDIFADLEYEPAPRLAAFDGLDRVIQIGSFSKTLSAALRCGYVATRADWIEGLIDLKIATSFGGNRFAAEFVHGVLTDGGYRRHLDGMREQLASAMSVTAKRLKAIGIEPWIEPRAGMFLWCRLPDGFDAAEIARLALRENIVLAPGNVFSVSQSAGSFLRFNAAQSADPRIFEMLKRVLAGSR